MDVGRKAGGVVEYDIGCDGGNSDTICSGRDNLKMKFMCQTRKTIAMCCIFSNYSLNIQDMIKNSLLLTVSLWC